MVLLSSDESMVLKYPFYIYMKIQHLEKYFGPGQVAQLVGASSQCTEGCGFDPCSQHMQESTSEYMDGWNNGLMSVCLSACLPPFPPSFLFKINK